MKSSSASVPLSLAARHDVSLPGLQPCLSQGVVQVSGGSGSTRRIRRRFGLFWRTRMRVVPYELEL